MLDSSFVPPSIWKILNDLLKTLDETYSRTLLGINEEKREYAQRLFRCLMVSIRPLRVKELMEILAIHFDEEALSEFNTDWRPAYREEMIMSVCSSLVTIVDRGGHQVAQFSHFSVKEYLTSERLAAAEERLSYYNILPKLAHTILAHASLSVLLHLDDEIDRDTIARFPLVPYAAQHWVDHAQFRNVSSHIGEVMKHLFNPTKPHFATWVWLYDIDRYWTETMPTMHPTQPEAVPLYYASLCGFVGLAEHLIAAPRHSPLSPYHRHPTQSLPCPLQIQSPAMLCSRPYRHLTCQVASASDHISVSISRCSLPGISSGTHMQHHSGINIAAKPPSTQADRTAGPHSVQISITSRW